MTYEEQHEAFKQALKATVELANGCNHKRMAQAFAEVLQSEHRTIQQAFLGVVRVGLHQYALTTRFDGRNAAAVEWAQAVDALPNSDLAFPFI